MVETWKRVLESGDPGTKHGDSSFLATHRKQPKPGHACCIFRPRFRIIMKVHMKENDAEFGVLTGFQSISKVWLADAASI